MAWTTTPEGFPINNDIFAAFFGSDAATFVPMVNGIIAKAYEGSTGGDSKDSSPDASTERPKSYPEFDASSWTPGVTDISHLIDPLTNLPVLNATVEAIGDAAAQIAYLNALVVTANALLKEFEVQEGEISFDF